MSETSREAQHSTDPEAARHPCSCADQAADLYPPAGATATASIELLLSQPRQRMVQGLLQGLAAGLAPAMVAVGGQL